MDSVRRIRRERREIINYRKEERRKGLRLRWHVSAPNESQIMLDQGVARGLAEVKH